MTGYFNKSLFVFFLITAAFFTTQAAKLVKVSVVDKDFLQIEFIDGEVSTRDDGIGETAFMTLGHESDNDTVKTYGEPLGTADAVNTASWLISSADDDNFGDSGQHPKRCFRKSKLNGMAENEWGDGDFVYAHTMEHTIYLALQQSMLQGKTYTLAIDAATNTDVPEKTFTFDIFNCRSEAVHCNIVGYAPLSPVKAVDLYLWMGDGGARDYNDFAGNKVYIYDAKSGNREEVGTVSFWKAAASEAQWYNLIQSDVWNADFSDFSTKGTYRIVIEGVGCSDDFDINPDIYFEPFRVSVQGFFYMRIGQDSTGGMRPVPRRPLYIPGVDPVDTRVYLTTMQPYHDEWESFSSGDKWDAPDKWKPYVKDGSPVNPKAKGGHSDAADGDRHLGHVSIIYDMLLPYIITGGAISDDNLKIAESGNGIPDIIDEARNEVDFWLNLRDGAGYSHGLTNPNNDHELFQAGPTAIAAWANAANSAMLADAFRIAGNTALMNNYRDSAIVAYAYANALQNPMLDVVHDVGMTVMRGRDLKMTAAAYLYNVTGNAVYETVINDESVCTGANATVADVENVNQLWGSAAYLFTPQTVSFPALAANMKASIINEAKAIEANYSTVRPSRRATDNTTGYFQTIQNVQRTMVAHAITDNAVEKEFFRKALVLEADWGLGRNPLNQICMTTASTPLELERSVENAYTSGGDDGTPGMHPGHTPYLNIDDWSCSMVMGCPSWLYEKSYPADFESVWPRAEAYFNTRYVWAHSEFTPQQTMRGKTALYGYLYGLDKTGMSVRKPEQRQWQSLYGKRSEIGLSGNRLLLLEKGTYLLRVFDCSGRTVWRQRTHVGEKGTSLKLPVVHSGLLILQVQGEEGSVFRKLLSVND